MASQALEQAWVPPRAPASAALSPDEQVFADAVVLAALFDGVRATAVGAFHVDATWSAASEMVLAVHPS